MVHQISFFLFQGYYYFHHLGGNRDKRDIYKDNPYYAACVEFCEKYDAPSFDPEYESQDIDTFRPMVLKIFSRTAFFNNLTHPKAGAVVGPNKD